MAGLRGASLETKRQALQLTAACLLMPIGVTQYSVQDLVVSCLCVSEANHAFLVGNRCGGKPEDSTTGWGVLRVLCVLSTCVGWFAAATRSRSNRDRVGGVSTEVLLCMTHLFEFNHWCSCSFKSHEGIQLMPNRQAACIHLRCMCKVLLHPQRCCRELCHQHAGLAISHGFCTATC